MCKTDGFFADGPDVETDDNKCETDSLRSFTNVCPELLFNFSIVLLFTDSFC